MKPAYGGVVLDAEGRILLRKPTGGYGGYAWTFPKGRPDGDESPEQTALREVREETGIEARILRPIPGSFGGDTTTTEFWLMQSVREIGPPDAETEAIRWVSFAQAEALIGETKTLRGRKRDLAVLDAARRLPGGIR